MNFEYQPSQTEIKKAEDTMTEGQKEQSEDRELEIVAAAVRARMKAAAEAAAAKKISEAGASNNTGIKNADNDFKWEGSGEYR